MIKSLFKNKNKSLRNISLLALTIALMALVLTMSTANATFVSLNKQHAPIGTFNPGDTITFTVTLNVLDSPGGSAIAIRHLNITDNIPIGLTYVVGSESHTPTASFSQIGQQLFWDFGVSTVYSAAPQAVVSFTVTVDTGASGLLVNQATAEYYEDLTNLYSNPGTTDSVTVNSPTPTPTPTIEVSSTPWQSQPLVGGELLPANILQMLAPYLIMALVGAIAIASLAIYGKRAK